ncbi:MAG: DUF1887 family protein [Clostridia bacterium]|nr:DUF1887 family protein [Clostridia bacterium]
MVLVEFFDKEPIDNLIGVITMRPEKVYLVGELKKVTKQAELYNCFLEHRNIESVFVPVAVIKNNIAMIVEKLSEIVESSDECYFGLTGGDDTALVSVGMVYEKYKNDKKIFLHRYNIQNNTISYVESTSEESIEHLIPGITVAESVSLHGGSVSHEAFKPSRSNKWDFSSEAFKSDVDEMWEISCRNPSRWNAVLGTLNAWESVKEISDDPLKTTVALSHVTNIVNTSPNAVNTVCRLLFELATSGLVFNFKRTDKEISFTYKNADVKRCLSKAGNVLELKTLFTAMKTTDKSGKLLYDEFDIQVCIDWDGKYHEIGDDEKDTSNEIDVVLVKGLVPFFISCKNGSVGDDELYKLNTVTRRFGGRYAKKVLVATHLGKNGESAEYFRQRAKDMGIILIDNVHEMEDKEFIKALRSLPSRNY